MSSSINNEITELSGYLRVCYSKRVADEAAATTAYWALKQYKSGTPVTEERKWKTACSLAHSIAGRNIRDARAAYYSIRKKAPARVMEYEEPLEV